MSQEDQSVANADGATVRADINANLQALVTLSSAATAPGTTWAGMFWYDSTNGVVKQRNAANSAWISRWTIGNSGIVATSTNDDATAGNVGEYFEVSLAFGSAVSLANTVEKTIISRTCDSGNWLVTGVVNYLPAASTVVVNLRTGASTANNTLGASGTFVDFYQPAAGTVYGAVNISQAAPIQLIKLASAAPIYLIGRSDFGASTMTAYGTLRMWRPR